MATAAAVLINSSSAWLSRPASRQIRVLTVDAHQLVQEGLAAVINREEDMTVVAAASGGEEAIAAVRLYRPDVVTLDLLLPDIPGDVLARRILTEFPQIRIVAVTSAQGHISARRALDAGVHGFLSKAAPKCDVVHAIRKVQAGGRMIPGPVASHIAGRFKPNNQIARPTDSLPFRKPAKVVSLKSGTSPYHAIVSEKVPDLV